MFQGRASRMVTSSVKDELMNLILDRGLGPGDLLPTESALVEDLGVSRNSVREALKALQALDIVEIRHGHGTYVGRLSLDPLADGLTFRTLLALRGDVRALREILQVRETLEDGLIRQVAATIPEPDLAALKRIVAAMTDKARAGSAFPGEDQEFHDVLYRSLDNEIVRQLLRAFWNVFHRVSDQLGVVDVDTTETVRRHRAILNALSRHDVSRAQRAMHAHFRNIDDRVAELDRRRRSGETPA